MGRKLNKEFIEAMNGVLNGETWRRERLKNSGLCYKNNAGNIVTKYDWGIYSGFAQAGMLAKDWVKIEYIIVEQQKDKDK